MIHGRRGSGLGSGGYKLENQLVLTPVVRGKKAKTASITLIPSRCSRPTTSRIRWASAGSTGRRDPGRRPSRTRPFPEERPRLWAPDLGGGRQVVGVSGGGRRQSARPGKRPHPGHSSGWSRDAGHHPADQFLTLELLRPARGPAGGRGCGPWRWFRGSGHRS